MQYPIHLESADVTKYRKDVISLFCREGKIHFASQFDWYYRSQGQEAPTSWILRNDKGQLCGLCSVTMRLLQFGGKTVKAGVAGNLLVDRTSGIYFGAFSLVRAMMSLVSRGQIDILLGTPNPLSQPIFRRLGFHWISAWGTHAMIFKSGELLRSHFGLLGIIGSPLIDIGAAALRYKKLWRQAESSEFRVVKLNNGDLGTLPFANWTSGSDRFLTKASSDYIEWRYVRDPAKTCRLAAIVTKENKACGYLAFHRGNHRIWIIDCAVDAALISEPAAIACFCRSEMGKHSSVWVASLKHSAACEQLPWYGFVPMPPFAGGSILPLVGHWLREHPLAEHFATPAAWCLFPGFNDV